MIFKNLNDFSIDLTDKILSFVSECNYEPIDILAIIKSYLHETKSINEIDSYTIDCKNNQFIISIVKDSDTKNFTINTQNEIRKRKLKNLKDNKHFII